MKNLFLLLLVCSLFFVACAPSRTSVNVQYNNEEDARAGVGYETFYHELSPYGRWIDYPGYGYVWVPNAEAGFRPYASGGHWVYTDYGWTWVSTYRWGWAPFHYGRWLYEDGYGWIWVPGQEWAPAWVTWGYSDGYYGWAPLAPGIHISVSSGWTPPPHYWNFVQARHITQVNVNNYVTNTTNNVTVVNNITKNVTIINNNNVTNNNITNNNINNRSVTTYNMGPARNEVERAVSHPIQPVRMAESKQPGAASLSNNQLTVYKPRIQEARTGFKPAPEKVEAYHASKSPAINPGGPVIRENAGAKVSNNHEEKTNAEMNKNALMEEKKPVVINAGANLSNNRDEKTNAQMNKNALMEEKKPVVNNAGANLSNNRDEKTNVQMNKNALMEEKKPVVNNAGANLSNNRDEKTNAQMNKNALMQEKKPVASPVIQRSDDQSHVQKMNRETPAIKTVRPDNGFNQKANMKDDKAENKKFLSADRINAKGPVNAGDKGPDKPNGKRKDKKDDLRFPQ